MKNIKIKGTTKLYTLNPGTAFVFHNTLYSVIRRRYFDHKKEDCLVFVWDWDNNVETTLVNTSKVFPVSLSIQEVDPAVELSSLSPGDCFMAYDDKFIVMNIDDAQAEVFNFNTGIGSIMNGKLKVKRLPQTKKIITLEV